MTLAIPEEHKDEFAELKSAHAKLTRKIGATFESKRVGGPLPESEEVMRMSRESTRILKRMSELAGQDVVPGQF